MANPIDVLTGNLGFQFSMNPQDNVTGFNPLTTQDSISKTYSYQTGVGVGQINQYFRTQLNLAASGTNTIDLTAVVNALGMSGSSFARIKNLRFRHLSIADGGSNATQVTIGNAASNAALLFLGAGTHTIVLANGGSVAWAVDNATGVVVNTSQRNILLTNNDATNTAIVEVVVSGGET